MAVETFGIALIQYGSDLSEQSAYGQALIKLGETEQHIAEIQSDFVTNVRADFVRPLEEYMTGMKNYKHLRSKMENRRLDYDAKLNRLQKSKKEKPDLDEEVREAQQKYEESLAEAEGMMIALNDCEVCPSKTGRYTIVFVWIGIATTKCLGVYGSAATILR